MANPTHKFKEIDLSFLYYFNFSLMINRKLNSPKTGILKQPLYWMKGKAFKHACPTQVISFSFKKSNPVMILGSYQHRSHQILQSNSHTFKDRGKLHIYYRNK